MSPLREAVLLQMRLRGFAAKTVEAYIYALEELCRFYRRPLETLTCADVQRFLDEIITVRKLAWATVNVYFSAYRFLYEQVLKRSQREFSIPPRGRSGKRPGILNREEVARLIDAPRNIKHRALLALTYGSGLRVSEVVRVRLKDVDRGRMRLFVGDGKPPGEDGNAAEGVWRNAHKRYLFGKDALAACFQARFIRRLESLHRRGKLHVDADPAAWDALIRRLWDTKWIVYPKPTASNPEQALDYLGRYTHRVAISDHRIRAVEDGEVTFTWRDRADGNTEKTLTIPCVDFIGHFLLHVLPRGFQKVRAYGWLAQRHKTATLAAIRAFLGVLPPPPPKDETVPERILRLTGVDVTRCPVCASGHLYDVGELPALRRLGEAGPRSRDGPA